MHSILPPPPDVRKVQLSAANEVIRTVHSNQIVGTENVNPVQQETISNLITTFIGDYIGACFPEYREKWLVQAIGNATFPSTLQAIIDDSLIINRKYIFLQLGGNQIRSVSKMIVYKQLLAVILALRERQAESHIFVVGVLPRPIKTCRQNHWL